MACWYCNYDSIRSNGSVSLTKRGFLKILAGDNQFFYTNYCPVCHRRLN